MGQYKFNLPTGNKTKTKMKDVCLCVIKEKRCNVKIHAIGIRCEDGKYHSLEHGTCFDLSKNTGVFEYKELTWSEFRESISKCNHLI